MVSKITIFEPHFDGAQFGPASFEGGESPVEATESDADVPVPEAARKRRRAWPVFAVAGLAVGLFVGMRALQRIRNADANADLEAVEIDEHPVEELATE